MDIFDIAIQMEVDSEKLYRDLSKKAEREGIKNILVILADAEKKHQILFKELKNSNRETNTTLYLKDVKNILNEIKTDFQQMDINHSQVELYKKAKELEEKAEKFYQEKANEVGDALQKKLLMDIAQEEHKHFEILDNIIEMITKPEFWVENAEFNHLDEY